MEISAKKDLSKKIRPVILLAALAFFCFKAVKMITHVSSQLAFPGASLYLLDYNFYIGSRTFIGSILTLLTPHITYQQIFALNIAVYVITVILFFVYGLSTVKRAIKEDNNFMFMVAVIFIVSPYGLLGYSDWVSAYDIYLCLFALLCCMAACSKHLHWVTPLLCVMAIFTHYAFVFSFFPAVFSVQFYNIITSKKKAGKIISTVICFLASFVSGVYCGFFANSTIKMSRDELYAYMSERLGAPVENRQYFDSYYFQDDVAGMLESFSNEIISPGFLTKFTRFFLPVMILLFALWCYYIIKNPKKQILSGALFILTMGISIAVIFRIVESPRWQTAATLSQFLILFALIRKNDSDILGCFDKLNKTPVNIAMIVFAVYNIIASFVITPYFVNGLS